ncbi:MAG TPA: galactokinase [Erysipelothrix sp.]|nr:galactokinase [Erysipelothrix sp.]
MEQLKLRFIDLFEDEPTHLFFAPGRINLIGEHIDYSGGHVFPCAITHGTYGWVRKRNDRKIRMASENFKEQGVFTFDLDDLEYREKDGWTNYVKAMVLYIQNKYILDVGFDIVIYGNIPNGAGLSSSASLEMMVGYAINDLYGLNMDPIDLVKLGVKTENEYIGVNSGIMDQFAVMMGRENHAMLLDTDTLNHDYVPLDLKEYVIVIMNTNKRRGLNSSKYNERRQQCEKALEILQGIEYKENLCDYNLDMLVRYKNLFEDELVYRRARHAITENHRTLRAKSVLNSGDLRSFGLLMNASHNSLRDDYDVTGVELDTIVSLACAHTSALGARVTGAGFGGCALAIVVEEDVDSFIESVGQQYRNVIGYDADFYLAKAGQGASRIK